MLVYTSSGEILKDILLIRLDLTKDRSILDGKTISMVMVQVFLALQE
jgi:hypothetical protein